MIHKQEPYVSGVKSEANEKKFTMLRSRRVAKLQREEPFFFANHSFVSEV